MSCTPAQPYEKKPLGAALKELVCSRPYMIALVLTAIFSYGYSVVHNSISTDDFTADIYYPWGGENVAQGRFTILLLAHLFRMMKNVPYFCDVLSVVSFALGAMLFCVFFDRACLGKLSMGAKIVFSCVLISYPAINEIFVYGGGNFSVCLGYVLTGAALLLFQQWYAEKKRLPLLWCGVALFFVVSLYESFAVVFLCGVVIMLILNFYYNPDDADKSRFRKVLLKGLVAIGILAAAVILESILGKIVLKAEGIEPSMNAANAIRWFLKTEDDPVTHAKTLIVNILSGITMLYWVAAPHYLPLLIIDVAVCLCFVIGVVAALFFALVILQGVLTVMGGTVTPLRCCQYYGVLIAFLAMLLFQRVTDWAKSSSRLKKPALRKGISVLCGLLAFWLVFVQAYDLNNWLFLDVMRSEEEIAVMRSICEEVEKNYDTEAKPVVFVGEYHISRFITDQCTLPLGDERAVKAAAFWEKAGLHQVAEDVETYFGEDELKFVSSNLTSYLFWAVSAFNQPNQEIMKLCHYLGYDFHTVERMHDFYAKSFLSIDNPAYPKEGYIIDTDEAIVVNLGQMLDFDDLMEALAKVSESMS